MKKYTPESPHGKIARFVEDAARDFGAENLTRSTIAHCLLLEADEISNDEWTEISEFALNAGTDVIRAMFRHVHPEPIDKDSLARLEEPQRAEGLTYGPAHDIFHAAEAYRLSNGKSAAPAFFSTDRRGRYINPTFGLSELYVELFETPEWLGVPFPIALQFSVLRERIDTYFSQVDYSPERKAAIHTHLTSNIPTSTKEWIAFWETFIELIILGNAQVAFGTLLPSEEREYHEALLVERQHAPEYYLNFVTRVFDPKSNANPRLFLDEFLSCIRAYSQK